MTTVKYINLVPEEIQTQWRAWERRKVLLAVAAVYVAALLLVFINQRVVLHGKRAVIASIAAERNSLAAKGSEYERLSRRLAEVRQAEAELAKNFEASAVLAQKRIAWSIVLKRLSNDIPKDVWLKTLSTSDINGQSGKKMRFVGAAASNRSVSEFAFMLENSGYFEDAVLLYTLKKEYGAKPYYDFEVNSTLKKSEEITYE